jgi:subfamily B ATP-binding cassette protein MsbA
MIFKIAAPPAWAGPAIVGLGLTAAILEGLGLFLFIPLIQSLGASPLSGAGLEHAFDRLLAPVPAKYLTAFLVLLLCASIWAKNGVNLLNTWVSRNVDGIVAHRLRARVFSQALSSCIDYRAGARRSEIATTIAENTWKVSAALSLIYRLIICLCTFTVFLTLMTTISYWLMLVSGAFLLLSALIIRAATLRAAETGRAVVEENKQFGQRMWESIHALQLIRAFGREDYEVGRFVSTSERVRRRLLKLDLLWAIPAPISEIAITLLIGSLILAASTAGVGVAALAAFLSLLYRLQGPARELMQAKVAIDGLGGALDDVANFLDATQDPHLADGELATPPLRRGIRFENVSFRYAESDPWALHNVSIEIPAGKTTAIVGRSGAGKTTLMSLLFRFQDPTEGRVTADGVSLTEFQLASWRAQLALMSQEVQLFNDTIEANIGYGDLEAGPEQIRAAAAVAHADAFIQQTPQGYQTIAGDSGLRLSGGQRQRIALARTILRNPDVLMLDEATNALDVESERAFQLALEEYSHKRTVVVIAHRLSTIERADQVIVLEGGRVIEAGPPAQLLDRKGHFARLYDLQTGAVASPAES